MMCRRIDWMVCVMPVVAVLGTATAHVAPRTDRPLAGPRVPLLPCVSVENEPSWPQFHVMNAATADGRNVSDPRGWMVEHLNDANAIVEYRGIYHVMCQGVCARAC